MHPQPGLFLSARSGLLVLLGFLVVALVSHLDVIQIVLLGVPVAGLVALADRIVRQQQAKARDQDVLSVTFEGLDTPCIQYQAQPLSDTRATWASTYHARRQNDDHGMTLRARVRSIAGIEVTGVRLSVIEFRRADGGLVPLPAILRVMGDNDPAYPRSNDGFTCRTDARPTTTTSTCYSRI